MYGKVASQFECSKSNFGQEPMAPTNAHHSRVNCVTSDHGDSRRKIRIRKPLKDQRRRGLTGLRRPYLTHDGVRYFAISRNNNGNNYL